MIKILHITTAKSWRGGERQVTNLIKSLEAYNDIECFILCEKDSAIDKRIVESEYKITHKGNILSWTKKINNLCKEKSIDLIHAHESKAHTNAILSSIFFRKVPVIVTRRVLFSVKGTLSKFKYQKTQKVICISSAVKEVMMKFVDVNNIKVIPSAIDTNKFNEIEDVNFDFLDNEKFKIAYVAAFTYEKDHLTFLKTAKRILDKKQNVEFYLVGDGGLLAETKQLVEDLNLQESVKIVGFIKNINALIPKLDLLLFTSISEGLGSTVLDFFLAKRPVVVTDSLGVRDIVEDKRTGFLCDIGDDEKLSERVIELMDDEELRNKIVQKAYDKVNNKFSLKYLAEKHHSLYKSMV